MKVFLIGSSSAGFRTVAARSKRAAAEAMGIRVTTLRVYGEEVKDGDAYEAAMSKPGTVFATKSTRYMHKWAKPKFEAEA